MGANLSASQRGWGKSPHLFIWVTIDNSCLGNNISLFINLSCKYFIRDFEKLPFRGWGQNLLLASGDGANLPIYAFG